MLSPSEHDPSYLHRATILAMGGRGFVEPNPMVGCVLVKHGRVIGSGWHQRFGEPHAEPNALAACREPPTGATLYVTLEPCCHLNKKTPPCVPAIVAAGIRRVVIGCIDPNPAVAGQGAAALRSAGIEVDVLDDPACRRLIAPFVARVKNHRPYITLKWARSADGKIAGPGGRRVRISNDRSRKAVHALRGRCDAVLVGVNTVIMDDPLLTVRDADAPRTPIRVVLDSDLRLPITSQLIRTMEQARVAVFCSNEAAEQSGIRAALAAAGVEVFPVPAESPGRLDLSHVMRRLNELNVTHLLVECGPTLAASLLNSDLWDRAWVFRSPGVIDETTAPDAVQLPGAAVASASLDDDVLSEWVNPRDAVASGAATTDFQLVGALY